MDGVTEDDTAITRGRIPPHDFNIQMEMSKYVASRIVPKLKMRRLLRRVRLPYRILKKLSGHELYMEISTAIHNHYYSYNKLSRPVPNYDRDKMEEPWVELNEYIFFESFGYYKGQFIEIINNLVLLPDKIEAYGSRATAPTPMALCIMLRRWRVADTWEKVSRFF